MAKMINLKINGISVSVPEGSTVLDAARKANVVIPTLCYLKDVNCVGSCRMCLVEATGARGLVAACVYPVSEGMEVQTNTEKVRKSRKMTLELPLQAQEGVPRLRAGGQLRIAAPLHRVQLRPELLRDGCPSRPPHRRLGSLCRARSGQVHQLHALRRGVQQTARRRDRPHRQRICLARGQRV